MPRNLTRLQDREKHREAIHSAACNKTFVLEKVCKRVCISLDTPIFLMMLLQGSKAVIISEGDTRLPGKMPLLFLNREGLVLCGVRRSVLKSVKTRSATTPDKKSNFE